MLNRFIRATSDVTRKTASQSAAWAVFVRDTVSGFLTTAHHTLRVLGLIAIGALAIMFVKPEIADQLKALSPFAQVSADDTDEVDTVMADTPDTPVQGTTKSDKASTAHVALTSDGNPSAANSRQQQWVTSWLAKRYRVANDATNMLVSAAYMTAKEIKLDPLLILSVMAIESGLNPFAESPVGAQGLMQVMAKVHHDKFEDLGGVKAALNPVANIKVGSLILKDYVQRGGSVEAGLKLYVGAGSADSDSGYGAKVLAEYRRLKEVAMGKKVPIISTSVNAAPAKPRQPEAKADAAAEESASADQKNRTIGKSQQVAAL